MKTHSLLLTALMLGGLARGGTFVDDYESYAQGAVALAPPPGGQAAICASTVSFGGFPGCSAQTSNGVKYLRLTAFGTPNPGGTASYKLPDLDPNLEVSEFTFEFDLRIYSGAPADGFSLNFGALPTDNGVGEGGFAMVGGLTVAWDTYDNGGEPRSIEVIAGGISLANVLQTTIPTAFVIDTTATPMNFRHVVVHWDANGLDLTITPLGGGTPVVVFNNQPTPGFTPNPGNRFGFSARTGGLSEDVLIDNLSVTTVGVLPPTTPDPIISEILAENEDGIEDEDFDHPDWIELYNGTSAPVNLDGWYLTDDAADLTKWRIPALNVPVYGYTFVFASGKNRTTGAAYHTNFTLPNTGGTLRLVKPDGSTVAHTLSYGPQSADTSYGFLGSAITFGYLDRPTPGTKNSGLQAPGPRVPDEITFLKEDPAVNPAALEHDDGTITAATNIWFKPPLTPGAEIRYTTNATFPTPSSTLYTGSPIPVPGSRVIRARMFAPGHLAGEPKTLSLVLLGPSLTNYRGTGAFKSNLPIMMMDSFTANVDGTTIPNNPRPYRYTFTIGYDPALGTGGKASLTDIPQFATNAGTHVRGQSSSGFPQRPYALETWDRWDRDKEVAMFGMPAGSDWALYDPYNEETLMRNAIVYESMRNFRGDGSAMRTRFVEVFFNQNDGQMDYADYRGVYLLVEKIKRDNDRINIEKLNASISAPALITGGYIFKKDKTPYQVTVTTTGAGNPWGGQTWEVVEPNAPNPQQKTYLQNTIQALDNVLVSAAYNNPVTGYRAHIDVPSFVDNHIWVEAFKQIDGYRISAYYTKERGQKIKALPVWDYNLAAGNANYLTGSVPFGWYYSKVSPGGNYPHYSRLFQDPSFVLEYWDRFWMIRRQHLTDTAVLAMIDGYSNLLRDGLATNVSNSFGFPNTAPPVESPVGRHYNRWNTLSTYNWPNAQNYNLRTTFQSEISFLKLWMQQRLQWMEMMSNDPAPGGMLRARPVNVHATATRAEIYQGSVSAGFQVDLADPNGIAGDAIYYTLNGTDPRAADGTLSGTAIAATGGAVTSTTLVSLGSTWKYLASTTAAPASDPEGDNWKQAAFDDSTWAAAPAILGYGSPNPEPTVVTAVTPVPVSNGAHVLYTRQAFNVTGAANIYELLARLNVDDSAVIYINGNEVYRHNMSAPPINIDFTSRAMGAVDTGGEHVTIEGVLIPFRLPPGVLVDGPNIVTVEVHQFQYGGPDRGDIVNNNDMRFDLELKATTLSPGTPITFANAGSYVLNSRIRNGTQWSPLTTSTLVVGAVPATAANLVVSEFHYHPADPTTAEIAAGLADGNDFEYIELLNISSEPVDLTGVRLSDAVDFEFSDGSTTARFVPPGQRVLIVENTAAFASRYPGVTTPVAGTFTGNLSNNGERITLLAANNSIIKDFTYDDVEPWPVAADGPEPPEPLTGNAYSLVLNNPWTNPDHALPSSWRASAVAGGKPGQTDGSILIGAPGGDDDGDGLTNLVEHAMGQNRQPAMVWAPYTPPGGTEANYLLFTFSRNLDADGISSLVETSLDLATWSSEGLTYVKTQHNGDGTATVTWRSTLPQGTLPARFFARLRIQYVP